jgi:hypothetical protein
MENLRQKVLILQAGLAPPVLHHLMVELIGWSLELKRLDLRQQFQDLKAR